MTTPPQSKTLAENDKHGEEIASVLKAAFHDPARLQPAYVRTFAVCRLSLKCHCGSAGGAHNATTNQPTN